jgi:hypothetical protein
MAIISASSRGSVPTTYVRCAGGGYQTGAGVHEEQIAARANIQNNRIGAKLEV